MTHLFCYHDCGSWNILRSPHPHFLPDSVCCFSSSNETTNWQQTALVTLHYSAWVAGRLESEGAQSWSDWFIFLIEAHPDVTTVCMNRIGAVEHNGWPTDGPLHFAPHLFPLSLYSSHSSLFLFCLHPSFSFFLSFGLSNTLSLPLSSHSRHWWIWWMSQSLVPLLTPGAQGPGRWLEQLLEQLLHQKTPGILMVYTNAKYTWYLQLKLDEIYTLICVCRVNFLFLFQCECVSSLLSTCSSQDCDSLLNRNAAPLAQQHYCTGRREREGEDVRGRYHEGKECGGMGGRGEKDM